MAKSSDKAQKPMQAADIETLNILYMDLSGWSGLSADQIDAYLTKALPKLAAKVEEHDHGHLNTWGDALVATFRSSTKAAECALDIRAFFQRTPSSGGVPKGLRPRVSLHLGDVIVAFNPLRDGLDVFGDAVHLAARLEPVTERGQVYCTESFAKSLGGIRGCGPHAHFVDELELPKGYGTERAYVVLGPNEDPQPDPQ